MRLALFAREDRIAPGALTGRGIVDLSPTVEIGYTPQLAVWSDFAFEKYEPGINPGAHGVEFFKLLFRLPLVVAGDFNSPINYKSKSKGGFLYTHRVLEEYGLIKAYNVATGEELFKESQATYYTHYKSKYPRHIDHIYVPREWKHAIASARCGEHDKWVSEDVAHRSNHAPLIVEVDDAVFRKEPVQAK